MKTKTRWTEAEDREFAAKLFARWQKHPIGGFSTLARWVLNNDWPAERKKWINGPSSVPAAHKKFIDLVRATIEHGSGTPEPAPEPDLDKMQAMLAGMVVRDPVPYDPVLFMQAQPTNVLVQELMHRFITTQERTLAVLERLEQRLDTKAPPPPRFAPVLPPAPVAPAPRRPAQLYIAIAGMLGNEFQHIREKVGDRAQLKNVDFANSNGQIPVSVDYLIWNTKFSSHFGYEQAKAKLPSEKIVLVSGGVHTITQKVFDLISRQ